MSFSASTRLEKNVQKTVHMTQGGLMEIYSSGIED